MDTKRPQGPPPDERPRYVIREFGKGTKHAEEIHDVAGLSGPFHGWLFVSMPEKGIDRRHPAGQIKLRESRDVKGLHREIKYQLDRAERLHGVQAERPAYVEVWQGDPSEGRGHRGRGRRGHGRRPA